MSGEDEFVTGPTPNGVAARLLQARLDAGLSLAEIAARTRVAVRHLAAIEEGRFGDLASRTYAVGFARAYARAVGLPEQEIAASVRAETDRMGEVERPRPPTFEPGDPARVPGRGLAWVALVGAIVLVAIGFFLWRTFFAPAVPIVEIVAAPTPAAASGAVHPGPAPIASASAAVPAPTGAVVFTATEPNIWVKFYDAAGTQLMQKQMAQGESYTVPAAAQGPRLWTGRPDALTITIGGRPVAPIATKSGKVKNVPVDAASLLARPGATVVAPTAPTGPYPAPPGAATPGSISQPLPAAT